jgi:His/Glu/Gln/Arg/opine family amino acid ABC transporter permease subunit
MELHLGIVLQRGAPLLEGLVVTVESSLIALFVGIPLGILICAGQRSRTTALRRAAYGYVWVLRTIPEALLVFWIYFCSPFLVPFTLNAFLAGSVAIGIVAGAYFAEIFRGGISTVPLGQVEAGRALGLRPMVVWTKIIAPQALRAIIPPSVNYFADIVKNTTILATIGVGELAFQAYQLGAETFRYFEFLTAIALIYFVLIVTIAGLSRLVERRFRLATR